MTRTISVVVASRANYGRIKSVLSAISNHSSFRLDLVLAASAVLYRFGDISQTVENDGFNISHKIYSVVEGENHNTMVKSTASLMSELSTYYSATQPDAVLTVADRHETLATAICASYSNIPLIHTQGGEQTGSIDDKVRHSITKLSNIHFPATENARNNLISMGENPDYVFNSGCPALDLCRTTNLSIDHIENPMLGNGAIIDFSKNYSLIVYHPVTDNLEQAAPTVKSIIDYVTQTDSQFIWLWPNVDAGSDVISKTLRTSRDSNSVFSSKVRFVRSYTPEDYLRVLKNAQYVLGNSSSFIRECSLLAVPALLIGDRQRSRELGPNARTLEECSDVDSLSQAISLLPSKNSIASSNLYSHTNSGAYIVEKLDQLQWPILKASLPW